MHTHVHTIHAHTNVYDHKEKINISIIFDTAGYTYEIFSTDYYKIKILITMLFHTLQYQKHFLKFSHELHI